MKAVFMLAAFAIVFLALQAVIVLLTREKRRKP